jgi:DNA replication and repair protein RecF
VDLLNFRNYASLHVELDSELNIFAGSNAQGKTNFLEAVHLLSTGQILRGMKDSEVIQSGSESCTARCELTIDKSEIEVRLARGEKKFASVNGNRMARMADLLGRLPSVTFTGDDLDIVRSDPSARRTYLDATLSQLYPGYLKQFAAYKRALSQRNSLLKRSMNEYIADELFEPWEAILAASGLAIRTYRKEFIAQLSPHLGLATEQISGADEILLTYSESETFDSDNAYRAELSRRRDSDKARGTTTLGPHRDDLEFELNQKALKLYGSQGQQRTVAIALKLSTLYVFKEILHIAPILLLDDIFSELDKFRQANLLKIGLENSSQVIMTCTEPEQAGEKLLSHAQVFSIQNGNVVNR